MPLPAATSFAASTKARAAGERWRSQCHATPMIRGGTSSSIGRRAIPRIGVVDGEAWNQGGSHSRRHKSLHRTVVVRPENHVGLDSPQLKIRVELRQAATLAKADEGNAGNINQLTSPISRQL